MKKTVLLLTAILFSVFCFSQMKKSDVKQKKDTTTKKSAADSIPADKTETLSVKFVRVYDTVKVRVTVFVEGGETGWIDGYQIKTYYVFGPNDAKETAVAILNKKFEAVKEEYIDHFRLFNWK